LARREVEYDGLGDKCQRIVQTSKPNNAETMLDTHTIIRIGLLRPGQRDRSPGQCRVGDTADPAGFERRVLAGLLFTAIKTTDDRQDMSVETRNGEYAVTVIRVARFEA
jgi:hypothetical protein